MPISAAYYANVALNPSKNTDSLFNTFTNRLSYTHQLIIASKVSDGISLEVLPTFVHRNMVRSELNTSNNTYDENDIIALGVAGRFKITKRTSFVVDYFHTFSEYRVNNKETPYYHPLAFGFEFETGGHVFHVNLSNSSGIIENDFIPNSSDAWQDGGQKFGFNISRVFNI